MFFPCSSPAAAPPAYGGVGGGALNFGGGATYPAGPFGLKPGDGINFNIPRSSSSSSQVKGDHQHHHDDPHYVGNNHVGAGVAHEGSEKMLGKKKGEKKVRRPKFAFQTRSQVDILDDGYRWRKYGQKAVKNNKFPRYYDPFPDSTVSTIYN